MFHKDTIETGTNGYVTSLAVLDREKKELTPGKRKGGGGDKRIYFPKLVSQVHTVRETQRPTAQKKREWAKPASCHEYGDRRSMGTFMIGLFLRLLIYFVCGGTCATVLM